jgi:hypothetical protein
MRRNAQKMMPHVMALNKKPTMGMKNDRQPAPAVSKLVAFAKGGKVMAKGGAADKKQDKSMLARHNRLMHPGQKSKLMNGGMVKKYGESGAVKKNPFKDIKTDLEAAKNTKKDFEAAMDRSNKAIAASAASTAELKEEDRINQYKLDAEANNKLNKPSSFGEAFKAARKEQGAGGTFTFNGKKYSTNRDGDDPTGVEFVVAYNKKKNPGSEKAIRQRFAEDLGMKKGGKVKAKGDKKKVMGTVGEAKAVMAALQKARRPATPMPGTPMAGLGMAPPMAPQMAPPMKKGGKVMKKAAGGAAKLRRKSPMPDKIKMVNYPRGG